MANAVKSQHTEGQPSPIRPSGGSQTLLDERTKSVPEAGDHERFSHYVNKNELTEAMVMGTSVIALCGKAWVPSRDPKRFPVCPECKEIWKTMKPGDDGDSSSDS